MRALTWQPAVHCRQQHLSEQMSWHVECQWLQSGDLRSWPLDPLHFAFYLSLLLLLLSAFACCRWAAKLCFAAPNDPPVPLLSIGVHKIAGKIKVAWKCTHTYLHICLSICWHAQYLAKKNTLCNPIFLCFFGSKYPVRLAATSCR